MRSAILATIGALLAACQHSDVSREIGARCDHASECDERCVGPSSTFPDGFCTLSCAQRSDCPSGSTCADLEGGICLFECSADPGCAFLGTGWRCDSIDLHGGGIKVKACAGS